jgi:uncharacterized integral membrane protein (TIGR00698 family)
LQGCVVLLGFGMDLPAVLRAGLNGALFAAATIAATLLLGYWVGRWLNVHAQTSALISSGTAVCGGSAIAAVGSVLGAAEGEIAVAMGTVFLLNAAALYTFPLVGLALHLSQEQFGVWAGVAIHDVSSVVGAASQYGPGSLQTAAAVKLSRSLWITPIALGMGLRFGRRGRPADARPAGAGAAEAPADPKGAKPRVPWFIGLFLLASVARSFLPGAAAWSPAVTDAAKVGMTLTLFLIGAGLSVRTLRSVGWRALTQGLLLWLFISAVSLAVVLWWV